MPEETSTHRRALPKNPAAPTRAIRPVQEPQQEPSYYDLSFLKPPVWRWEISTYFFCGGLAAGSYVFSRVARFSGGHDELARAGSYISLLALVPCAPLLIHDLGDPKRFHHMLRIFKPSSPMSLGTWTLTAFSGASFVSALREWMSGQPRLSEVTESTPARAFSALNDAVGIPLALLTAGYTGVLLSCTANPLWSKSLWLGPLFTASALGNGSTAIALGMELTGTGDPRSRELLHKIGTVSHAAEMVALAGFTAERGELARPLHRGSYRGLHLCAIAGVVASEVLKHAPLKGRAKTVANIAGALLGLAGGVALRVAIVHGGHEAAADPRLARKMTRGRSGLPA